MLKSKDNLLLERRTENIDDCLTVYDVFYNQFEEQKKDPLQKTANQIKIEVNYEQLRKYIPNFDANSPQDLQKIAKQLLHKIKVNRNGIVTVDSSMINPHILKIVKRKF